jgi:hypothetical protein
MLSGCLAKAVVDVATSPVKLASGAVDMATTSQSEADEKRGRELRKREEHLGKLQRSYQDHSERCRKGDQAACTAADAEYGQIQEILPTVPVTR